MQFPKGHSFTDQYLVDEAIKGNQQALGQIVRQTEGLVAQIVFKMIPAPADRQDLVQDVYLKAFRNLAGFKFNAKLSTWVGKITYNTCLHYLEKKKLVFFPAITEQDDEPAHRQHQPTSDVEKVLSARELASILDAAVKMLSPP